MLRRGTLDVPALYSSSREASYAYSATRGHNPRAIAALLAGMGPCVPGWAASVAPAAVRVARGWALLFEVSWFFALATSTVVYIAASFAFPPRQSRWHHAGGECRALDESDTEKLFVGAVDAAPNDEIIGSK